MNSPRPSPGCSDFRRRRRNAGVRSTRISTSLGITRDQGCLYGIPGTHASGLGDARRALIRSHGPRSPVHRGALPRRRRRNELSQDLLAADGGEPLPPLHHPHRGAHSLPPALRNPGIPTTARLPDVDHLHGGVPRRCGAVGGSLPVGRLRLPFACRVGTARGRRLAHRRIDAGRDVGAQAVERPSDSPAPTDGDDKT